MPSSVIGDNCWQVPRLARPLRSEAPILGEGTSPSQERQNVASSVILLRPHSGANLDGHGVPVTAIRRFDCDQHLGHRKVSTRSRRSLRGLAASGGIVFYALVVAVLLGGLAALALAPLFAK